MRYSKLKFHKMKRKALIIFLVGLAFFMSGCQPPKPAALSDTQVIQSVDHFLQATQTGDYQTAISDFSDHMKAAYSQGQFNSLRDLLGRASGHFEYCSNEKPSLTNSQGYATYHVTCKFQLEDVAATISFKIGGTQIEGLYFSSTGLLKLTK